MISATTASRRTRSGPSRRVAARPNAGRWLKCGIVCLVACLVVLAPIRAKAAASCGGFTGTPYAFARVSPLEVSASETLVAAEPVAVAFGQGLPVLAVRDGAVEVCIDAGAHWVRRSNVLLVGAPEWIGIEAAVAERPRLRFWRSQERLAAHLSERSAAKAPPDYEEVIDTTGAGTIRLPVADRDVLETSLNNVQVKVASVLVPFLAAAVEDYRRLRLQRQADAVLLIDTSGSTAGFVPSAMRVLAARGSGAARPLRMLVIEIDGNGRHAPARLLSPAELGRQRWRHQAATDMAGGAGGSVGGFDTAAARLLGNADKLPMLIAAGGDITLTPRHWATRENLTVLQLTPELEPALAHSAQRLGAAFRRDAADVAGFVDRLAAAEAPHAAAPTPEDHAWLKRTTNEAGFIAVLPNLAEETELAIPPAFAVEDARWFAVPLWLVLNDLVMELK
jgi:hypothetical protein